MECGACPSGTLPLAPPPLQDRLPCGHHKGGAPRCTRTPQTGNHGRHLPKMKCKLIRLSIDEGRRTVKNKNSNRFAELIVNVRYLVGHQRPVRQQLVQWPLAPTPPLPPPSASSASPSSFIHPPAHRWGRPRRRRRLRGSAPSQRASTSWARWALPRKVWGGLIGGEGKVGAATQAWGALVVKWW